MTKTEHLDSLTDTQAKTLAKALVIMLADANGELAEFVADSTKGIARPALQALVAKGILATERREFVMPIGPMAGETLTQTYYRVAK